MKYYIVRVAKYTKSEHKMYKKYKCVDGYSTKKRNVGSFPNKVL